MPLQHRVRRGADRFDLHLRRTMFMAGYKRKTAMSPSDVLSEADRFLPEFLGLSKSRESGHGATFMGEEGTVTLSIHRHGPYTEVVASTDRLRTSRMDYEIQRFLNRLPYEPGDQGGGGSGAPVFPEPNATT